MRLNTMSHADMATVHAMANQMQNGDENGAQTALTQEEDVFDIFSWANNESNALDALFAQDGAENGGQEMPEDLSGSLTRRLVSANNTFIVHRIIGDAFKNLGEVRLALAMSNGDDADTKRQIIRRLERVIRRGNRKIRELNRESALLQKQERAERDNRMQRAREIETQLRRHIERRRNRERGYLEELAQEDMRDALNGDMLDAATKAKITALARVKAAMSISAGPSGGGGFHISPGMPQSDGTYGGGSMENGLGAEAAISAELDVSV